MDQINCSFCDQPATHSGGHLRGWGDDGDFYCDDHVGKAPIPPHKMEGDE